MHHHRNESQVWKAEVFAKQAAEWMGTCGGKKRCPMAEVYDHLIAQQAEIDRLKAEVKRIEEWPNER